MDNIINKVRTLIGDYLTNVSDIFTYENSKIFSLTENNVGTITEVYVNDAISNITHTYSSTSNKVTITTALTSGDTIKIDYTAYQNYSDTEITSYIQAALVHLSINNYYNFEYDSTTNDIYPTPESKEENLIAIVTSLLINPDNRTIRLPDLTINLPNDLPTDQKISKTIARYKHDSHGVFDLID
jgi:hypothetical protein